MATHSRWDPDHPPAVAVFGAGIAGLTAAHELIERGFRVQVFEEAEPSPLDPPGFPCAVGGVARTQWSRAERPDPFKRYGEAPTPGAGSGMASTDRWAPLPENVRIAFSRDSSALALERARTQLDAVEKFMTDNRHVALLEVRGFCEDRGALPYPSGPQWTERIDYKRAAAVRDWLVSQGIQPGRLWASALGCGYRGDWARDDEERAYVDFRVIEDLIPGEHGFRFFPAFYRNLFDTMRRTPLSVEHHVFTETARTVLDNVIRTTVQRVAFADPPRHVDFPRHPVASVQEMFDVLSQSMRAMGFTMRDVVLFHAKLFQYLTSCPERRAAEYERISWYDFLDGDAFSDRFRGYLDVTGQMLVSMTARESDARSFGSVTVQLLQDQYLQRERTDGTLNGPTSLVWLNPWRDYLQRQGVEFIRGKLSGFRTCETGGVRALWPLVQQFGDEGTPAVDTLLVRDYYVVALDARALRALLDAQPELDDDDFDRLRRMDLTAPTSARPQGALQHMSGIQYYFTSDIRFVDGHIDFPDSEWGLSSVSQPQFWTRRRGWWSGYRGVLSVDICNWFRPSARTGKCAWESTKQEIAEEVWRQITAAIGDPVAVPAPILYHLDDNIELDDAGRPTGNRSPYLINRTGEFVQRPGCPDAYGVPYDCLVLAGSHMRTHTRMMTMESANESARHAVNAILGHCGFPGDRCTIFNPEEHEPPALVPLMELDRELFRRGLPHVMAGSAGLTAPPALVRAPRSPVAGAPRAGALVRPVSAATPPPAGARPGTAADAGSTIANAWRDLLMGSASARGVPLEIDVGENQVGLLQGVPWLTEARAETVQRLVPLQAQRRGRWPGRPKVVTVVAGPAADVPGYEWLPRKTVRTVLQRTDNGIVRRRVDTYRYELVPVA